MSRKRDKLQAETYHRPIALPIDLLASLLLGLAFAAFARRQLSPPDATPPWRWELAAVVSFEIAIRWPSQIYLRAVHPGWSVLYLVDGGLGATVEALLLAADLACLAGGWFAGWAMLSRDTWSSRRRDRTLAGTLLGVAVAILASVAIAWGRLSVHGTVAEVRSGHGTPLLDTKLPAILLVLFLGTAGGALSVGWTLRSHGRRRIAGARPSSARTGEARAIPEPSDRPGAEEGTKQVPARGDETLDPPDLLRAGAPSVPAPSERPEVPRTPEAPETPETIDDAVTTANPKSDPTGEATAGEAARPAPEAVPGGRNLDAPFP